MSISDNLRRQEDCPPCSIQKTGLRRNDSYFFTALLCLSSLFLMVPRNQFPFQELEEQVENEAQHGEDDDAGHEAVGHHEVAVVEDEGADALFRRNHFRCHQKEEGGAGGYAEAGEDHGEGVGQHHVSHGITPAGVEAHGHFDEQGVHVFHAGVGVHGHGEEDAQGDDGDFGYFTDAQPEDEKGEQGDFWNGVEGIDDGVGHAIRQGGGAGDKAYEKAEGAAQDEAHEDAVQGGRQGYADFPVFYHVQEGGKNEGGRRQEEGGYHPCPADAFPEKEEGCHGNQGYSGAVALLPPFHFIFNHVFIHRHSPPSSPPGRLC